MTDYKSMFEQAVRTLAAIDEALGIDAIAVLLGLLTDCAAIIKTIEGEDSGEAEKLNDLLSAIDRAIDPSRHKGALI